MGQGRPDRRNASYWFLAHAASARAETTLKVFSHEIQTHRLSRRLGRGYDVLERSPLQLFGEGCGANGPLAFEAEDPAGNIVGRWSLGAPFGVIGRDSRSDVTLEDPQVSRRHVYVQVVGGGVFWVDLDSRVGVVQNGVAEQSGWLRLSETIGIGPLQLRLVGGIDPANEGEPARPNALGWRLIDDGPADSWRLEFFEPAAGSGRANRFPVSRALTLVGKARQCRLRVAEEWSSRYYGAIVRNAKEVWAVDLQSSEGLRVNGVRARWSLLKHGDKIHFGPFGAVVRFGGSEEALARQKALMPPASMLFPAPMTHPAPLLVDPVNVEGPVGPLIQQFSQLQQQMFEQFHQAMQMMLTMVGSMHQEQMSEIHQELERIREISRDLHSLHASPPAAQLSMSGSGERPIPAEAPPPPIPKKAFAPPRSVDQVKLHDIHTKLSERIASLQNEQQTRWQKIIQMVQGGNK